MLLIVCIQYSTHTSSIDCWASQAAWVEVRNTSYLVYHRVWRGYRAGLHTRGVGAYMRSKSRHQVKLWINLIDHLLLFKSCSARYFVPFNIYPKMPLFCLFCGFDVPCATWFATRLIIVAQKWKNRKKRVWYPGMTITSCWPSLYPGESQVLSQDRPLHLSRGGVEHAWPAFLAPCTLWTCTRVHYVCMYSIYSSGPTNLVEITAEAH